MNLIDSHCHLSHVRGRVEDVLAAASNAGVSPVIDIGMGTAESAEVVGRAERMRGDVFAAVGIHPNDLAEFRESPDETLARLRTLGRSEVVVAVGETGLDFYRDREEPSAQEAAFAAHNGLAKELGKALVVHTRGSDRPGAGDAHNRVLEILEREGPPERVVLHCFSGDATYARACAGRGFFCSFAGNLTYKKNAELREAARTVPPALLLVETDAPFLAPEPFRRNDNSPALVPIIAGALAEARSEDAQELAVRLARNARRAFSLPNTGS